MNGSQRILILGAQGQLGVELQRVFRDRGEVIAYGREQCDLSKPEKIRAVMAEARPDVVLNAAAYTAVDRAESEKVLAMTINGDAPGVLAEEARKRNALLVHYSTDYVFDGLKDLPWVEEDQTNPLNAYGASKLAGERNIEQAGGRYFIFRTSWVFAPHGANFLRTMLRLGAERDVLKIVNDQTGAPTSALAIARGTREALDGVARHGSGVYHMSCAEHTTWCGFAQAIFRRARAPEQRPWAAVEGIPTAQYPTPAVRPKNSALSNEKLRLGFGVALPAWESALDEALATMGLSSTVAAGL